MDVLETHALTRRFGDLMAVERRRHGLPLVEIGNAEDGLADAFVVPHVAHGE